MCTHNASGHGIGCQAIRTQCIYIQAKKKNIKKIEDVRLTEH